MNKFGQVLFTGFLLILGQLTVLAHRTSDAYLSLKLEAGKISGRLDIALKDLEFTIGLDADGNGVITWSELEAKQAQVFKYAKDRLGISDGSTRGDIRLKDMLVDYHADGGYAVLAFEVLGLTPAKTIEINYGLLFDHDASHHGIFQLECNGKTQSSVFSITDPLQKFSLIEVSLRQQIASFGWDGVWHIWTGYDHILFLIALLLPAVLSRQQNRWLPVEHFRPAFINVFKIVTAFTLAHSITLTLATVGIVRLPARLVESAIAASVVLAAANNLTPFFQGRAWIVAFGFGLIHGFGFANVLIDLGLPRSALAVSLVSFNLGVELGQLAIVSVFLPLAYGFRASWYYQRLGLIAGSGAIVLIAAIWFCERAFDFKLLPF